MHSFFIVWTRLIPRLIWMVWSTSADKREDIRSMRRMPMNGNWFKVSYSCLYPDIYFIFPFRNHVQRYGFHWSLCLHRITISDETSHRCLLDTSKHHREYFHLLFRTEKSHITSVKILQPSMIFKDQMKNLTLGRSYYRSQVSPKSN